MNRKNTYEVKVRDLHLGGDNKILIQSMCNIPTKNYREVIKQINALEEVGCDLVRFSILDEEDAKAIKFIKAATHIPLVADIHYDYKLAILAAENGIDKLRINPGNIGSHENVKKVVAVAKEKHIPIRIGVNGGSLEKNIANLENISLAEKMILSAKSHVKILEDLDFFDIVISLKASDANVTYEAYKLASTTFPYPLHLGVTETGNEFEGLIKSSVALVPLLKEGIGNTIRISLSADPLLEVKAAKILLKTLNLRDNVPSIISCPTCGRTTIDVIKLSNILSDYLNHVNKNIVIAVMGCPVNGLGEGKNADIGITGADGNYLIFKKGVVVKHCLQEEALAYLFHEIDCF